MGMIGAVARLLALIVSIVAAFVAIPQVDAILLVLGMICALVYQPADYVRVYASAIVLIVGAKALDAIPAVGMYLADIFTNIGTVLIGLSVACIAERAFSLTKAEWMAPKRS